MLKLHSIYTDRDNLIRKDQRSMACNNLLLILVKEEHIFIVLNDCEDHTCIYTYLF